MEKDETKNKSKAPAAEGQQPFTATAEQIAEWKKKHKDVFALEVVDDREEGNEKRYRCYIKSPERSVIQRASAASVNSPMKFQEIIFANAWIAGDENIRTDDYLALAAEAQVGEVIKIATASIKKV